MIDRVKRGELARFLRSRRERLTPEAAGLPPGGRRRTNGLRREEVAVLAGVSPAWYASLEQGRSIHPSREVVDSIGNILQFSEDERLYVRTLLEGSHAPPLDTVAAAPAVDLMCEVVKQNHEAPFPVYATDHRCNLLAWNPAAREWYDDWDAAPLHDQNFLYWLLTSPLARERLMDWEAVTQDVIARWRAECAHHAPDQTRGRIDEFHAISPEFRQWWDLHEVSDHRQGVRRFRHDEFGERALRIVPLFSPEIRPCGLIFHVPL